MGQHSCERNTGNEETSSASSRLDTFPLECGRISIVDIDKVALDRKIEAFTPEPNPDMLNHRHHYDSYVCNDHVVDNDKIETSSLDSMLTSTTCSDEESFSNFSEGLNKQSERTRSILKTSKTFNSHSQCRNLRTSFSTLEVREYSSTLGDNPGGRQGPPITLEWYYNKNRTMIVSIENYEDNRLPRRSRSDLYIPNSLRIRMLMREKEFTLEQLYKATKDAELVRMQRRRSAKYHGLYLFVQKALTFRMRSRRRNNSM